MTSFNALRVQQVDGGTRAGFETLTLDALSAGEVVVRVAWSSINYKDALAVTGAGRIMRGFPRVAGIDLSGIVESSADPRYGAGDKVLVTGCGIGEEYDGGFAEFARVRGDAVVPLPPGLSLYEAMALGTAGFTAAFAVQRMQDNHQTAAMGPIAVTGPTGGVGSIAIALFSQLGYETVAITGKADRGAAYLRGLGASEVLDRGSLGIQAQDKPLLAARWGGAVDNLGGDTLAWLTRTVKPWGNIASIGLAQGPALNTTVMPFILRGVSLLGIHSVECPRPWRLALWAQLQDAWKPRALAQIAPRVVPLAEVPRVCAELIAGSAIGRTVVAVGGQE